jgi:hypothetical protein
MKNFVQVLAMLLVVSSAICAQVKQCCTVTAVDVRTGTVTANEDATRRAFVFKVTDAKLLATLRPGQGVFANFSTHQVSIDGKTACGQIVSGAAPGNSGEIPGSSAPSRSGQSSQSVTSAQGNTKLGGTSSIVAASQQEFRVFFNPTYLKQDESTTGTVALKTEAGASGVQISLSSDAPGIITLPANVKIGPGQKSATFSVGNRLRDQTRTVKISAFATSPGAPAMNAATTLRVGGTSADTGFDRARQGFQFSNYWNGRIYADIPIVGRIDLGAITYGLCGGMSASAADAFYSQTSVPQDANVPPSGSQLRAYIYDRQMDSFRDDNGYLIRTMIEWMPLPMNTEWDVTGLQVRSDREFRGHIRPELDQDHPIPVALLKASASVGQLTPPYTENSALFKNHQVLAVGYSQHGDHWDIHIYDPNYKELQTLHTGPRYQTTKGSTTPTETFRALFSIPYSAKRPYWESQPGGGR